MSWWVYLVPPPGHQAFVVPRIEAGGTYAVGGSADTGLNITYNYSQLYHKALDHKDGLRWLHGKAAGYCIDRLRAAVAELGTDQDPDYWRVTPGNAGYALSILLWWATLHPEGVFEVN